ncbi:hypothetical protein JTE90_009179 [Oedothorax gibbosus]|uniref:Uncharacterized protein n=1 Tax=Oedothorax gibbosus TaxID=931172 RepID=A0AAV6UWS3_9ARAC|nr:hypothetical protein JTE90_009179 [Oedothorax gibbosus]
MQDIVQRRIGRDKRIFQVYDTHELCKNQRTAEIFQKRETQSHRELRSVYFRKATTSSQYKSATGHLKLDEHCVLKRLARSSDPLKFLFVGV